MVVFIVKSMSESASWVKEKTTEGKCLPQEAGSPASSGGPSFLTITGETCRPLKNHLRGFHTVKPESVSALCFTPAHTEGFKQLIYSLWDFVKHLKPFLYIP